VAINEQCSLGDVHVSPNDVLVGDADGIVVIPSDRVDEVLKIGKQIEAAEDNIRAEIAKGSRLDEAREKFKYHALQTRDEK
jgi:regulator of RNase E activity RraA